MTIPRYLPATRTKVRSLRLGPLSVRTSTDGELGTLMGFLVDPRGRHVCSLVMEVVSGAGFRNRWSCRWCHSASTPTHTRSG